MQLSDREIQNTLDLLKKQRDAGVEPDAAVALTDEDREGVRAVVRRIGEPPEVRQERVEKLKRALETASYDVTGDDVAKKLIGRMISDKIR